MRVIEWLSRPCYDADICGYTIFIPPLVVDATLRYLQQYRHDCLQALTALMNNAHELPIDEVDKKSLPAFVEAVEQVCSAQGASATINLLQLYHEYLSTVQPICIRQFQPEVCGKTFYAPINQALALFYIPSGIPSYAAVHLWKSLHTAIRFVYSEATRRNYNYEDVWLINGNIFYASAHNYHEVVGAAELMSLRRNTNTLSEFMP